MPRFRYEIMYEIVSGNILPKTPLHKQASSNGAEYLSKHHNQPEFKQQSNCTTKVSRPDEQRLKLSLKKHSVNNKSIFVESESEIRAKNTLPTPTDLSPKTISTDNSHTTMTVETFCDLTQKIKAEELPDTSSNIEHISSKDTIKQPPADSTVTSHKPKSENTIVNKHTDIRFECNICGKTYSYKTNLTRHKKR